MNLFQKLKDEKLSQMKHKYFGLYRGIVTNVNDPLNFGRVKAKIHELFSSDEETDWAAYCSAFAGGGSGWFFLPDIGDCLWFSFEAGDINKPIWLGFAYSNADKIPAGAGKTKRVLKSKSGHQIVFDDTSGRLLIQDKSGQRIEWDANKSTITIESKQKVIVNAPLADIGQGQLSGVVCNATHPTCLVTGQPIGCSQTVKVGQ